MSETTNNRVMNKWDPLYWPHEYMKYVLRSDDENNDAKQSG